jgi:hypothetical protein
MPDLDPGISALCDTMMERFARQGGAVATDAAIGAAGTAA